MNEIDFWSEDAEKAFIERHPNGFKPLFENPATIDKNGYRHVFCVVNARGARKYFDRQKDAIELARESKWQPTRIIHIPIMNRWEYHTTPLEQLILLIEDELGR